MNHHAYLLVNAFLRQLFSAVTTYKTMVVHALKEHSPVKRRNFCDRFHQSVNVGELDPQSVLYLMRPGFLYVEE
jgi:hypothetical protein